MSVNNGKFINAFKSIKMIGDYEYETNVLPDDANSQNVNNSIDHSKSLVKNDSVYNGDELYNPLEVEDSDDDSKPKSESKVKKKEDERVQNISPISSPEPVEIRNSSLLSNDIREEEFSLQKSPEKADDNDFLDDDDLLGNALAELEEEEKQMQKEKEEKESKKKKKKKDKDEKKKKKKKKKRKGKGQTKDKDDKEDSKSRKKEEKKLDRSLTDKTLFKEKERHVDKEKKSKKDKKKEKKHRDHSRDRDARSNKHRNSTHKEPSLSDKHKKEKENHSDHYNHRKRSHRSRSPVHNTSKRSRRSDVHEKRDQKYRHSSRSPSSKDKKPSRTRSERDSTSPRREKKLDKVYTHDLLSKEEFDEIQKDAKKMQRRRSSGSSSAEQQRLVIEDVENNYKKNDLDLEDTHISRSKSPHNIDNSNIKISVEEKIEENKLRKSDENKMDIDLDTIVDDNDIFNVAISSQLDNGSVCIDKKSSKPGALSIHEYKERRKSGKDSRLSSSSQSEEEVKPVCTTHSEKNNKVRHNNHSEKNGIDKEASSLSLYDVTREGSEKDDNNSIPLLSDSKENIKPENIENESPYNPEASPLDFDSPHLSVSRNSDNNASPSQAAVEDDDVDILAYKDVVAFEDIMRSKVKHEAKKHKRKKLEEMRQELEKKNPSGKEKRLVDYLIRQAKVEDLMKSTLKTYFKSREITKEEYKYILKKAVPQVTMSGSSIVPAKIESLMVKFVRKCKGQRAKEAKEEKRKKQRAEIEKQQKELQQQIQTNAEMLNTLGGFEMKALNPNLPLPPM